MKTHKLILLVLAIILTIPAFTACEPSPDQMEKALQTFFDKNPQFLEKKFQDVMRKRNPEAEPIEERIKKAIAVDLNKAPTMGPDDAVVTIVIFSDFQCPFCKRAGETPKQLVDEYKGKVRIAFRQHPLPMHKQAMPAAKASLAAHEQGKFWQYHDLLFENQKDLSEPNLIKIAQQAGLNVPKFTKALKSTQFDKQIQDDMAFAMKNGATGTPAFFVNGVYLKGAKPITAFREVVDKILEMKGLKPASPAVPAPAAAPTPPAQG